MNALANARDLFRAALIREEAARQRGAVGFIERRAVTTAGLAVVTEAARAAGLDPVRVEAQVASSAAAVRDAAERLLAVSHLPEFEQ
jgi:uncharacterized glyoxalase superfamily metalloenzyme YdcJ